MPGYIFGNELEWVNEGTLTDFLFGISANLQGKDVLEYQHIRSAIGKRIRENEPPKADPAAHWFKIAIKLWLDKRSMLVQGEVPLPGYSQFYMAVNSLFYE